jgi:exopolyphosphatase/guanosine-5'-triphosphate,3'-diphosphate pyrophosphatase
MLSAVIDTGYNSTRLCIYDVFPNKTFRLLGSLKFFLRIGEGIEEGSSISEDKVKEIEKTFNTFKILLDKKKVKDVKIVGTSAFRYASNGLDVAKKVSDIMGSPMKILSGEEEGKMAALGVINTLPIDSGVIFDLGGGSLEVIYFESREIREIYHFRLGALKLSREYKSEEELRKKIRNELSILKPIKGTLIGSGGNMRALGKLDQKLSAYPLKSIHGYVVKTNEISKYSKVLMSLDPEERSSLPGISKERAYTIHTASVVIEELAKILGASSIYVSAYGMREGVLIQDKVNDLKKDWLDTLAREFSIEPPWEIFDSFNDPYMKLSSFIAAIMKEAGFLDPYETCFRFLKYSTIAGFEDNEILISSLLCKGASSKLKKKYFKLIKNNYHKKDFLKMAKEVRQVVDSSVAGVKI